MNYLSLGSPGSNFKSSEISNIKKGGGLSLMQQISDIIMEYASILAVDPLDDQGSDKPPV